MGQSLVRQGARKLRAIRPARIHKDAHRPFLLHLHAPDAFEREALARLFLPDSLGPAERRAALAHVAVGEPAAAPPALHVRTPSASAPGITVDPAAPDAGLLALLRAHPDHRLALGRVFPVLRPLLARELIQAVASRNAAVAALSALPEVFPTPLSLVLALGEMGSDTVLITANQIGLAFELAALHGEDVGWRAQSGAVLGLILAAFGWRTLARELVGLIPAGIGLAAKSGIAYSGTIAVGHAMWRTARGKHRAATAPPWPQPRIAPATQAALASQRHSA